MARAINMMSARKVATLSASGRHADGGGLYLRITPAGAKSWVFMTAAGGKRTEIGLGAASAVGLAAARQVAADMREAIALGHDPRAVIAKGKIVEPMPMPTFGAFAEEYIASVEAGWKNPTHRQQWRSSLRDHAGPLNTKTLSEITTDDVLAALRPIWMSKPETASRVRGRIERVLDAARAHGHLPRDAPNPARLKGHLDFLLPKQPSLTRGHHAALPYGETAAFMTQLRQRSALAARCLEFTILTAARSGEALGATWSEIDLEARLWTVPRERMKAGQEHTVPLSASAIALLQSLQTNESQPADRVFTVGGSHRSNMAMAMLLRRMGFGHVTTHGFRSTFRDWAGDCTSHPREIIEGALAHTIQNKAEKAYRRGTAIDRRRVLMNDWSAFLAA